MSERISGKALPLAGLVMLTRHAIKDERGSLQRMYCAETFAHLGIGRRIEQINLTHTSRCGTVRGMHFQYPPHAEMKVISCLRGQVFDVAVDLRRGSSTFLHWHGEILSPESANAIVIPEGFAHGFQALTDNCELLYLHSATYFPQFEGGVRPDDSALGIAWPLEITEISGKDASRESLKPDFEGINT